MKPLALIIRLMVVIGCLLLLQEPRLLIAPHSIEAGDQALQQGKAAEAIRQYRQALEAQPDDAALVVRLVSAAVSVHRPDMAELYLRQFVALRGWSPEMLQTAANIQRMQDAPANVSEYLLASLTNTARDIPTLRELATDNLERQNWNAAIAQFTQLSQLAPNDDSAHYELGLLTLPIDPQQGMTYLNEAFIDPEYQPVITALRETLTKYLDAPLPLLSFQIGLTLMNLKLWPYAEHALHTSIEQGNNAPAVLAFLGVVQDQQGRDGGPLIENAYAQSPNDSMVNYASALHWRLMGDAGKALTALARAATLEPKNPAIAAELGLVYQMVGRLDYAALWLNIAVALAPNNKEFRTLLATFYADTRYDISGEGIAAIRKIAEQLPNDATVRASLGWALFSNGQIDAARVELEQALLLDSTNVRARYYYGILMENRGDIQGAIDSYLYVYRDAPENEFTDLAASALRRLGYNVDPNQTGS